MMSAYSMGIAQDKAVFESNCSVTDLVGDAVYLYADNEVRKAIASNFIKGNAIGIIEMKMTPTSCVVRKVGVIDDLYTNLEVGEYFLSQTIEGEIQNEMPLTGIIKVIGYASSAERFFVDTSRIPVKK
jgi:hypothetical protein